MLTEPDDNTLVFYNDHARVMAERYEEVDFSGPVDRFAWYLRRSVRVLEIGTGSGRDAARLLTRGYDVAGIDGSKAMIAAAVSLHPELSGRLTHHALPEPLPFVADSFEGVCSWAVLMHLPPGNLPGVFLDIGRVTAHGGIFAYSVNTQRTGLDESGFDPRGRRFTCLPATEWEQLHRSAGFRTLAIEETDDITGRAGIRWATMWARKEGHPVVV